jgi:hypothetical protein
MPVRWATLAVALVGGLRARASTKSRSAWQFISWRSQSDVLASSCALWRANPSKPVRLSSSYGWSVSAGMSCLGRLR